jgi:hypothetical protein
MVTIGYRNHGDRTDLSLKDQLRMIEQQERRNNVELLQQIDNYKSCGQVNDRLTTAKVVSTQADE